MLISKISTTNRNYSVFLSLFLFLITILAYLPALSGNFIWTDLVILEDPILKMLGGLKGIWFIPGTINQYQPVTYTLFWIESHLWQMNPNFFHLVNIVLHGLNSILIWILLKQIKIKGSWLAAAIFALHPIHVDAVAWISQREILLSVFFSTISILSIINYCNIKGKNNKNSARFYLYSLLFYFLAIHSSSLIYGLPIIFLFIFYWMGKEITKDHFVLLTPFFLLSIMMGYLMHFLDKYQMGAAGGVWDVSLSERVLLSGNLFWFYLLKLLWPTNLMIIYPRWDLPSISVLPFLLSGFFILFLFLTRSRINKGPFIAVGFFLILLFPVLGFFNLYSMKFSFAADHYQYFASLGPITLIAFCLSKSLNSFSRGFWKFLSLFLSVGILSVFFVLTWNHSSLYANPKALWTYTFNKNPSSWVAYKNMGDISFSEGNDHLALSYYQKAIEIETDSVSTYFNMATIFLKNGNKEKALEVLKASLENSSLQDQTIPLIFRTVALIFLSEKEIEKGLNHAYEAVYLNPYDVLSVQILDIALKLRKKMSLKEESANILEFNPEELIVYRNFQPI